MGPLRERSGEMGIKRAYTKGELASMGPLRERSGEHLAVRDAVAEAHWLQWGRCANAAESKEIQVFFGSKIVLQWGRCANAAESRLLSI